MLELQHPITSILGITFKDLFPGYFVLVFLTYVSMEYDFKVAQSS